MTVETADVQPREQGLVTLRGGELPWRPVSPKLTQVRLITLAVSLLLPLAATIVLATLVTPWVWIGTSALLVAGAWSAWVIVRQVGAMSWTELDEEIVIRKGRLFRTLVSVPYGRLQYVDVQSGPLMRAYGLASIELHTASPSSGGALSGLPVEEAEGLRTRLAARGESQRAGL
ncbi:MAG TPA: PH domain-containing protein [Phycicoccus sp.]|jgi:membrane protein YdbS with pleckstrin-like domain|nr:PH domain-containing protein [Phycicoccus sp.]HQH06940.1 PH domain-containing protein [Phycicoccus sp.]HQK30325.1 PH domain-containing protein [Phycicoccus sp.]HQV90061.1 PH domain-containing protein [Phycicoccus sp.]HQY95718.1 PH domain-containing protein [Phycicoccus sp.]